MFSFWQKEFAAIFHSLKNTQNRTLVIYIIITSCRVLTTWYIFLRKIMFEANRCYNGCKCIADNSLKTTLIENKNAMFYRQIGYKHWQLAQTSSTSGNETHTWYEQSQMLILDKMYISDLMGHPSIFFIHRPVFFKQCQPIADWYGVWRVCLSL